jgi:hypothetical protein
MAEIKNYKISNLLPLSENPNTTRIEETYTKKTPDGWLVCIVTATGSRYKHYQNFSTKEEAQTLADSLLEIKTMSLVDWAEMGRFE